MQSSAGLVSQEKRLMNGHMIDATQDQLNFRHKADSLSPGASTVATAFDSQAQTIGALARSGYRGRFYTQPPISDDIEKDSISNSDNTRDLNIMNRADQRNKKLSWQHEEYQVMVNQIFEHNRLIVSSSFQKNDVSGSLDLNGSTENNLIVYF